MTSPHLTKLSEVAAEEISWLWPGRLARGKMTMFAGDPGLGKSRLSFDMAARITTGARWPDGSGHAVKGAVLMVVGEDGLSDTVRPAIDSMGGDPAAVYILNIAAEHGTRPLNMATDVATFEQALEDVQPQLVVIDPISAFLGKTDSYKDAEVRATLSPLLAVLERHHAALLCIAHLSKDSQRAALHRPGGSIAFVASARLVFAVAADPDDADRRILAPLKSNICKPAPSLAFRLPDGCIEWEAGPVNIDATTLLAPPTISRDHGARDSAEDFLRQLLADGPVDSARVFKEAAAIGIAKNTLRRAQAALGVTPRKTGLNGGWLWMLNEASPKIPNSAPISKNIGIFEDTHVDKSIFEDSEDTQDTHYPTGKRRERF